MLAQGILYRGRGPERRLAAVPRPRRDRDLILFSVALARFRKTIGTMA